MTERRPPRYFWLARLLHATVAKVVMASFRTTALGMENVPGASGAILAGNHVSYADPILLWCRSPRRIHFMAKSELWGGPFGWILDRLWAFPVKRGAADREAIATASAFLRAGELVGMFPEGTRSRGGEGEAHGGVAFLALREGVPVVPVGVAGTSLIMPEGKRLPRFPRVVLSYGAPVMPQDFEDGSRRERTAAMTSAIMTRIDEEIERAEADRK